MSLKVEKLISKLRCHINDNGNLPVGVVVKVNGIETILEIKDISCDFTKKNIFIETEELRFNESKNVLQNSLQQPTILDSNDIISSFSEPQNDSTSSLSETELDYSIDEPKIGAGSIMRGYVREKMRSYGYNNY